MDIVALSEALMREQTKKNGAPNWQLTEIAIQKGRDLSKIYNIEPNLVLISLYLAHTIFDQIWKGEIQKNHPQLSAAFAKKYLNTRGVDQKDQEIIINAILAHHGDLDTTSQVAEIVKNAECFKFVSMQGSLVWLHELGSRQIPFDSAVKRVIQKMEQEEIFVDLDGMYTRSGN